MQSRTEESAVNNSTATEYKYTLDQFIQLWDCLHQLHTGPASMVCADLRNYFSSPSKHPRLSQQLHSLKADFPFGLQDLIEALVDDIKRNDAKLVEFIKEQGDDSSFLDILENRRTEEKRSQELPQSLRTGNDHIIPKETFLPKNDIDSLLSQYKKIIDKMRGLIADNLSYYQYATAFRYCEAAYDISRGMIEKLKESGKSQVLINRMISNMAYSQYRLGYIYYLRGGYANASALYQTSIQTLDTISNKVDQDYRDMANMQKALGLSLRRQGQQADAYRAFGKALTLLEKVRRKTEKINSLESEIAYELARQGTLLDTAGVSLFSLFKPDASLPVNLFAVKRIQQELKNALTEEELKLLPLQEFMELKAPLRDQLIKNIQRHRDAELDNPYLTAINDFLEEKQVSSLADILEIEEDKFAKLVKTEHVDITFHLLKNQITLQQLAQMSLAGLDDLFARIAKNKDLQIALKKSESQQTKEEKQLIADLLPEIIQVSQNERLVPNKKL